MKIAQLLLGVALLLPACDGETPNEPETTEDPTEGTPFFEYRVETQYSRTADTLEALTSLSGIVKEGSDVSTDDLTPFDIQQSLLPGFTGLHGYGMFAYASPGTAVEIAGQIQKRGPGKLPFSSTGLHAAHLVMAVNFYEDRPPEAFELARGYKKLADSLGTFTYSVRIPNNPPPASAYAVVIAVMHGVKCHQSNVYALMEGNVWKVTASRQRPETQSKTTQAQLVGCAVGGRIFNLVPTGLSASVVAREKWWRVQ